MKTANKGKKFENNFKESALKYELFIIRLNDTELSFMRNRESRFTPTNPCDFICFKNGKLFMLELKSTEYNSIPIQRIPTEEPKMIKAHQINSLIKYSEYKGVNCGFVLNFREKDSLEEETYYISIQNFSNFLVERDKKSINKLDVVQYGGIKVEQQLKRTQYLYNVDKMLSDIINQNIQESKE